AARAAIAERVIDVVGFVVKQIGEVAHPIDVQPARPAYGDRQIDHVTGQGQGVDELRWRTGTSVCGANHHSRDRNRKFQEASLKSVHDFLPWRRRSISVLRPTVMSPIPVGSGTPAAASGSPRDARSGPRLGPSGEPTPCCQFLAIAYRSVSPT